MSLLLLIFLVSVIGFIPGTIALLVLAFFRAADGAWRRAAGLVSLGVLVASTPFISWSVYYPSYLNAYNFEKARAKLKRIPSPLRLERTEYELEESSGFGGPGDNEAGFAVYRLTADSRKWLRGGANTLQGEDGVAWKQTPIPAQSDNDHDRSFWVSNDLGNGRSTLKSASAEAYLDRYGHQITVHADRLCDIDTIINKPGSLYRYTEPGGITIVDPEHGRVYFLYAG